MTERMRLSVMDGMFLLADTRETPMHVGGLQVFKVPPRARAHFVANLYAKLRTFPVTLPPLNYRLTGGVAGTVMPSWEVAEDVDLNYHVRHSALPSPGGERELGMLVSRLHSTRMDLSRPLWEYHLIEGLAGDRFAVYTKLHHAMVDGAAAMRLVNLATDPAASFGPPFWADESKRLQESPLQSSSLVQSLSTTIGDEVKSLPSLVRSLATTARAALGISAEPDRTSIAEAPRTLLNVRVGAQRRVATYSTSLRRCKAIGTAAGGTINDVVLAACGSALRRYLAEREALPEHTLIAAVPMALSHATGAAAGNAVSALNARLGTDTEDIRQRFETICRTTAAGKAQLKGMTQTCGDALRHAAQPAAAADLAAGRRQADRPAVEPDHLQRPGIARAAVLPRRRDGRALPRLAGWPRHGAQHHRAELCGRAALRIRRLRRRRAERAATRRPHGSGDGGTRSDVSRRNAAASRSKARRASKKSPAATRATRGARGAR